ncbi:MBL fold metallo-hydrolase [Desulfobacula sp.]|uniref:MBL fold metallo-hydrolase n=1 Tax=Desulfobacula sp. TaxID=2593537 RepID=UPI0025C304F2|nr:MBL fold metallo-hydrolase [Desulfobacula sp.]MBC2705806.1 MBL fold metallo-hydrolase [Desulfobacula sp.]
MEKEILSLCQADSVEITTLVDNFSDVLLPSSKTVIRPPLAREGVIPKNTLLAEHGLSLLVKVRVKEETHSIILDTGYTNVAVPYNLEYLGLSLEEVEAVVLSHGHMDHVGALREIVDLAGAGIKLILHPDAFLPRVIRFPSERLVFPAFPSRDELKDWGADVMENKEPLLLCKDSILVTGEVPRTISFEKGLPGALIKSNGEFVSDTFKDDQSLVINLGNKGLVVISGCAHAGIINSVLYAGELTGNKKICAVIGGFHLSGAVMEPSIEPTIEEMKKMAVQVISPMHCTGFKAITRFAEEMPDAFILNSVGSRIIL